MKFIVLLIIIYLIYRVVKGLVNKRNQIGQDEFEFHSEDPRQGQSRTDYRRSENKSLPPPTLHTENRLAHYSSKPAKWYRCGEAVNVKGYNIPGGLIYVGDELPERYGYGHDDDACLINPSLGILKINPDEMSHEMGYWPRYSQISGKCRAVYLKWLAGGRMDPLVNIGYVFLFFYGLERRLLIDGVERLVSQQEQIDIINEIIRLLNIYGGNRSFRGYANGLLAMQWILHQNHESIPKYINFDEWHSTEAFQLYLAKYVASGKPIKADIAFQWYKLSPGCNLKTPARRCPKAFRILFKSRYANKFGDGLVVKPNKTRLTLHYRAASPSLGGQVELSMPDLPNPFILTSPIKKIGAIIEDCTQELDPYSRYLGRKNSDPKSLAAWSLIPKELVNIASGAKTIKERLAKLCNNGIGFLPLTILYKTIGHKLPAKLSKKDLESLAVFIEKLGFGIAPDLRYHHLKPTFDGNIAIFPQGHGMDFQPSKEFQTVGTILRLGAMVSQIDDDIAPAEESLLQNLINNNRGLTNTERDSLLAFLHWCLRTPQKAAGLKERLSGVSQSEKDAISHILVALAHADGVVHPEEIKQLERLYKTLGLDKNQVATDLHTMAADNGPVTVGRKDPDVSFAIPQPEEMADNAKGFALDEGLLKRLEEDTKQVQGLLVDIFTEQDEDEIPIEPVSTEQVSSVSHLAALDEPHLNFFNQLKVRETWERAELQNLCKKLGLMMDGAMEVLNEWALENTNAPLIEDGDPIYVDTSIAKEIINVEQ